MSPTVQYGSISLATTVLSGTATITSVDTTKSVVMNLGMNNDDTSGAEHPYLVLTNATTVTATRKYAGGSNVAVKFLVITFTAVKSLQSGVLQITGTNTSATATITSVNTSKAMLVFAGFSMETSLTNNDDRTAPMITLTNATTVTATRNNGAGGGITYASWAVVEFS